VLIPWDQVPGARGARLKEEIRPKEADLTVLPEEVGPHGRVLGKLVPRAPDELGIGVGHQAEAFRRGFKMRGRS